MINCLSKFNKILLYIMRTKKNVVLKIIGRHTTSKKLSKKIIGGGCLTKKCKKKKKEKEARLAEMEGESQGLKDELKAQIESMSQVETDIETAKEARNKLKDDLDKEESQRKGNTQMSQQNRTKIKEDLDKAEEDLNKAEKDIDENEETDLVLKKDIDRIKRNLGLANKVEGKGIAVLKFDDLDINTFEKNTLTNIIIEKVADETGGIITSRSYIESIKYEAGSVLAILSFSTQAEASLVLSNSANIIDAVINDYNIQIRSKNKETSQGTHNEFYLEIDIDPKISVPIMEILGKSLDENPLELHSSDGHKIITSDSEIYNPPRRKLTQGEMATKMGRMIDKFEGFLVSGTKAFSDTKPKKPKTHKIPRWASLGVPPPIKKPPPAKAKFGEECGWMGKKNKERWIKCDWTQWNPVTCVNTEGVNLEDIKYTRSDEGKPIGRCVKVPRFSLNL